MQLATLEADLQVAYTGSKGALGRLCIQTTLDYTLPLPCLSGRFVRRGLQRRTWYSTLVNKTTQVQGQERPHSLAARSRTSPLPLPACLGQSRGCLGC